MALGRRAFGFWGNLLPSGLNAIERVAFPLLTVVFLAGTALVLLKADPGATHQAVPGRSGSW